MSSTAEIVGAGEIDDVGPGDHIHVTTGSNDLAVGIGAFSAGLDALASSGWIGHRVVLKGGVSLIDAGVDDTDERSEAGFFAAAGKIPRLGAVHEAKGPGAGAMDFTGGHDGFHAG